ncbi:Hypothetical predicted protein [Cloeon dipterum]|uniref:Integrase catalytic domain-containing protein n=1 Tax=Cloeon dipterum TaxID=197152 RepID=A0A8S1E1A9_9INSE|nr:Hypothetical predicted protein [Cloeon dipterum]
MDVERTKGLAAEEARQFCRRLFRTHGICDVIVADNGPAFSPASNGVAERAVQTVKNFLKKTQQQRWEAKLDSFLLGHNATPNVRTGVAPAEYNLGRRPQTILDKIHPSAGLLKKKIERDRKAVQALRTPRFREQNQRVVFRNFAPGGPKWEPGKLKKILGPRRVLIESEQQVLVERHADQVKPVGSGGAGGRPPEDQEQCNEAAAKPRRVRKPPDRLML